ncbi:protein FAM204A-like [Uloborus diversus]|uniref:protein FAM204A-like n=1 Tax=Uloborus diversus TaxID=327109 RepID=UPI0024099C03|nr:protein FAM204A-like [Uloborus diversus]
MDNASSSSSASETDDLDADLFENRNGNSTDKKAVLNEKETRLQNKFNLVQQQERFTALREKVEQIRCRAAKRHQITEERKSRKLVKRALNGPEIKELVENYGPVSNCTKASNPENTQKWLEVKPFLTINDHLQGPVSHGDCGPKTELEYMIEDAIKEGDFEKAELLSDSLANRQFAVKIAKAFEAKKCSEKLEQQNAIKTLKKQQKIHWTFEAKERWQMKGNM